MAEPVEFTPRERRLISRAELAGVRHVWALAALALLAGGFLSVAAGWLGWRFLRALPQPPTRTELVAADAAIDRLTEAGLLGEVMTFADLQLRVLRRGAAGFWTGALAGAGGVTAIFCFALGVRFSLVLADIGPVAASARLGRKLIAVYREREAERAAADARDGRVPP